MPSEARRMRSRLHVIHLPRFIPPASTSSGLRATFPSQGKAWDFRFQGIRSTLDSHCQLSIKKAFVSHNKRQRHNFLCGTTLVPFFDNGTCARCIGRTRWGLLPRNGGSAHCSEGISHGASCRLAPTGGSLKRGVPGLLSSSWHCICLPKGLICGWDRSSGRTAGSGWQTGWWWYRRWGAWVLPWGPCPPWNPPGPPRCGQSRRLRSRCHTA